MHIDAEDLVRKSTMKRIADCLEEYLFLIDDFVIFEDLTDKEYEEAVAVIRKLIKHLRKGEADKVYVKDLEKVVAELDDEYPF